MTGAEPEAFGLQLKAIEYLYRAGVQVQPAVMISFSPAENIRALRKRLGTIDPSLEDIEMEELVLYGDVEKRLRSAKIGNVFAQLGLQDKLNQIN